MFIAQRFFTQQAARAGTVHQWTVLFCAAAFSALEDVVSPFVDKQDPIRIFHDEKLPILRCLLHQILSKSLSELFRASTWRSFADHRCLEARSTAAIYCVDLLYYLVLLPAWPLNTPSPKAPTHRVAVGNNRQHSSNRHLSGVNTLQPPVLSVVRSLQQGGKRIN